MKNNIKILKDLKNHLVKNFGDNIKDVILFGSQVTGNATEYSDYDVLIVLKNNYSQKFLKKILYIILSVELKFDIFIDTKFISSFELKNTLRGKLPIFKNTINTGIYA